MFRPGDYDLIDLSIGLEADIASEPWPPTIETFDHEDGAERLADRLREIGVDGIQASDFPGGIGLAWEQLRAITHTGTHMDAPWHYGPESAGAPAKTIDQIPLDSACGQAVVLDVTDLSPGTEITPDHIDDRLAAINHDLEAGEIVLLETGADDLWGSADYLTEFPGMGAEATNHLVEQGIRVIGTDAYGFDKPFSAMGDRFAETGDPGELWPAHFAGREVEYCQIEKMGNLDALPRRTDIPLVTFPIKIIGASAGWVRPVAFIE